MRFRALTSAVLLKAYSLLIAPFSQKRAKGAAELAYWHKVRSREIDLKNSWYVRVFTDGFGLDTQFFVGKRMLDIGCGPSGTLEWADMAAERVGLDPLANEYRKLRNKPHKMKYVAASSESIPFPDSYFDVVSAFNSLDHVDDLESTVREIERVAADTLLLITDVNHAPTRAEPQSFSWDVVERFAKFDVIALRRYEKGDRGIYASIDQAVIYDDQDESPRYGVLVARLRRKSSPAVSADALSA